MASDVFALRDNYALYQCLGVGRDADLAEIKRAWRRLAAQLHPDKNPSGEARFKEVSFAYRVLSDPEQRKLYDSQRLRSHINRRRDPALDPDAELSPEALRDFIASLMRQEQEQEERRRSFELRRRDEYARRERFEQEHPGFAMPPLPSIESVRAKHGGGTPMLTTAELRADLDRRVGEREDALACYGLAGLSARAPPRLPHPPAVGRAPGLPRGDSLRRDTDSLDEFRSACAAAPLPRQRAPPGPPSAPHRAAPRSDLSFAAQKQYYNSDVSHIRAKGAGFDYTRYVQEARAASREQLSDAILSDALEGYVPVF